jgi:hypothetical protein
VSTWSRTAANVSTRESAATPGSSWYPQNWPRTTLAGSSGAIASRMRAFSLRSAVEPPLAGASIVRQATTCSIWFWMTSRIAPVSSVEASTPLHTEALGHGDLHALDGVPVPQWLEERVAEPEVQQVLDRFFAEVVIDAEDRRLREHGQQRAVERLRGRHIVPKRLLDHHTPGAA